MTKGEFSAGMTYLKKTYPDWNFDASDPVALKVWYSKLRKMSAKDFDSLISAYTDTHEYPPRSPASLINIYSEHLKEGLIQPENVWGKTIEILNSPQCYWDRGRSVRYISRNVSKALAKTVDENWHLIDIASETSRKFIQPYVKQFTDAYEKNLNAAVQHKALLSLGLGEALGEIGTEHGKLEEIGNNGREDEGKMH